MKRNLRFLAGAFLLTATALFTGCNSDDDFLLWQLDGVWHSVDGCHQAIALQHRVDDSGIQRFVWIGLKH